MSFCESPPRFLIQARTFAGQELITMRVASGARDERPVSRSTNSGAWKPSTALRVTQMRLLGMVLNTSVQAERQGPSMITRSPDCRTRAKA